MIEAYSPTVYDNLWFKIDSELAIVEERRELQR